MLSRVAVLASGRGSNCKALWDYLQGGGDPSRAAAIVLVASDQPEARVLALARERGLFAVALPAGRERDSALRQLLAEHRVDLVALAGYLRLVPPDVVRAYRGRIVNVHPALLPAFGVPGMYGHRVHDAVLASGARVSGATVHFVDEEFDRGAVIAQWPVPVYEDDTRETLAARVLRVEHVLFPRVVSAVARGAATLDERGRARGPFHGASGGRTAAFVLAHLEIDGLASGIERALA